MTDFFSIFQPGMQHVREQRDFEKVRFVEAPDGAPGTPSVDLDAGTATIVVPTKDGEGADEGQLPGAGH